MESKKRVLALSMLIIIVIAIGAVIIFYPQEDAPTYPSPSKIHGLNFGPYVESDQAPPQNVSESQIRDLIMNIAPYTEWVRTYTSLSGLDVVGRIGHELGLKVAIQAWLDNDLNSNEDEINNVINIAKAGEADMIVVGSETLFSGALEASQLIDYLQRVKEAVPSEVIVTTSDTAAKLRWNPSLISECDIVFPTIYPFWSGTGIDHAINRLEESFQALVEISGEIEVVIAETGWPSSGGKLGNAVASLENSAIYFKDFVSWATNKGVHYFYFEAYDEPWKTEAGFGSHWGIFYSNGSLKPGMESVFHTSPLFTDISEEAPASMIGFLLFIPVVAISMRCLLLMRRLRPRYSARESNHGQSYPKRFSIWGFCSSIRLRTLRL